ncbi:MAG TPA: ABC transporter permease [Accumulibacter sp.]|nr:ABC transporter permease [Accumulibacter sp.]HMW17671.1 ABC transporter permease [Accumulibacter sp.]HMX22079.1 ABC transporter permease [Accumulibacter sp.]HNC16573.1 ABC transporter permease [Accumulibacter sp.]HND79211.1 ABC transporter permease [Accumulibacter sp.]
MTLPALSAQPDGQPSWSARFLVTVRTCWRVSLFAAQIVVLAFMPSSYRTGTQRQRILTGIYWATVPLLPSFIALSSLLSLVLIRIVLVTAMSYGLSQYALGLLVRTLVIELIPLYAAMVVAVRYSLPSAHRIRERLSDRSTGNDEPFESQLLRGELLPRALAAAFSVHFLATLSGLLALILTYMMVYGVSPWGLPVYTHHVGQVFTPPATLIFALKTFFFSLAVAIVPMAACIQLDTRGGYRRSSDIGEFARLFSIVLMIEVLSLIGNYY